MWLMKCWGPSKNSPDSFQRPTTSPQRNFANVFCSMAVLLLPKEKKCMLFALELEDKLTWKDYEMWKWERWAQNPSDKTPNPASRRICLLLCTSTKNHGEI
ncbi:hypothetical protein DV515_00003890 [Chloebia gouldiae]|uniref:Uncharacterized protein n=1 Tax=Chloebia gouldiae TaxID=44316 RepID=A0A3L8SV38_CHLGU|nr:hypothetical protein DV515_00003890 [Chloebia gouldiae]